jgi:hypothetical protein
MLVVVSISAPIGGEKQNSPSSEEFGGKEDPFGPETGFYLADPGQAPGPGPRAVCSAGRSASFSLRRSAKSCMSELPAPCHMDHVEMPMGGWAGHLPQVGKCRQARPEFGRQRMPKVRMDLPVDFENCLLSGNVRGNQNQNCLGNAESAPRTCQVTRSGVLDETCLVSGQWCA